MGATIEHGETTVMHFGDARSHRCTDDPASRRERLQDVDLFTKQGKTRAIP